MNFGYPGFLFALLAIAIPIVIHLFNFRKFKKVYFSNVQFLKEAKEQNSSREKLKHLLILISRILAVTFLVLAFARPFIPSGPSNAPALNYVVSIYIDNSYSMETVNKEGSLLDEAKRKAKEIVGVYGLNDRFKLITNDFEGRHQRLVGREELIQMLDEIKISAVSRGLQQVMNRVAADQDKGKNQASYLISDFQNGFLKGVTPATLKGARTGDISYNFVKLNSNSLPNISVDSVWSLSPVHKPGQTEQVVVQLKNYGEEDAAAVPLKMTVNNQQKAISNVAVAAGKTVTDTLSFSGLQSGWQQAVLSIKDFPLTFDDQLNFTFKVSDELKVLSISGVSSGVAVSASSEKPGRYIAALYGADPYFKLTELPESNIQYSSFSAYSLIVLSGLQNPTSGLAQELKTYAQNGGSVVIFPDLDVDPAVYNGFLNALSLPSVQQLVNGQATSSSIDPKQPLFRDVFDQVPKNMDLPVVSRYFSYASQSRGSMESILQLPLERSLFARYRIGAGKIYLSAASLDLKDGNLPRHPVFVPMMYKVAFGSVQEQPLFYTNGLSDLLEMTKVSLGPNQSLKLVSDQFEVIPEIRQTPAKTLLYVADQVRKSGFYNLKLGDSTLAVVAFNDNRAESDMHYATESELKDLSVGQNIAVFNSRKDAQSLNIGLKNNSNELWKLCIILTVVFLAIEILLIRFFNKTKNTKGT
ncbi:MAG: VWA domain-containing protein [Bacteroidota bacterium]